MNHVNDRLKNILSGKIWSVISNTIDHHYPYSVFARMMTQDPFFFIDAGTSSLDRNIQTQLESI